MPQMLTSSFSVEDLTVTSTGINNTPNSSEIANLKKLAEVLEIIDKEIGSFRIASGFRNPDVNSAVGGSPTSKHMKAVAADLVPKTMTAQDFWLKIISNITLMSLLGEISWKTHQGSIHVTLAYPGVKGSPRIADKSGYYRHTTPYGQDVLSKYGINPDLTIAKASVPIGLGVLVLGLGGVLVAYAIKKRN